MTFTQFLNENLEGGYSSFEALPKSVKNFFIAGARKNILSKVVGLKNFSISIEGEEIYFIINGNKILVPFINYVNDEVIPNKAALIDKKTIYDFYKNIGGNENPETSMIQYYNDEINIHMIQYYHDEIINMIKTGREYQSEYNNIDSKLKSLFYIIFQHLRDFVKDDRPLLNPFNDIDLKNNHLIQLLDKLGAYVDTSDARKKKGILRFSLRDFNYGLIIQPNGYMRIDLGSKTPVLTSKMEISGPAYTEDDLNIKLAYLVVYLMKDILKKYNVPVKTINLMAKAYGGGDFDTYNNLIKEISLKYPSTTSLLPDPQSVLDPDVKKGTSMLRRFGAI